MIAGTQLSGGRAKVHHPLPLPFKDVSLPFRNHPVKIDRRYLDYLETEKQLADSR
jgi:hypothetical protein